VTIDFGVGMPARPPTGEIHKWMDDLDASLPKLAGRVKSLWLSDHFFWDDLPTWEAWTTLSFAAARWPQFQVGPMVLGQGYRNPALLAKMAATLQNLSSGRFIMGIGAGWKEDEYRAYNYPYPPIGVRMEQLIDTLEILKRMWTEPGKVTYHGKHYQVVDAYCEPKPNPVPPILVGGSGNRTMSIAARYADWWNMPDVNVTQYSEKAKILRASCEKLGRDPATLRLTWWGRMIVGRNDAEARTRGGERYNRDNALFGTPQQIVEQIRQFIDAGVTYFMATIPDLPDVVGIVTDEILVRIS
jgi:alkanesulfonate monooxygenase SsuD/methylene tetrahydromethanopterin reductase-like flavin-dependent oxidoreductase (luciferase family)